MKEEGEPNGSLVLEKKKDMSLPSPGGSHFLGSTSSASHRSSFNSSPPQVPVDNMAMPILTEIGEALLSRSVIRPTSASLAMELALRGGRRLLGNEDTPGSTRGAGPGLINTDLT